MTKPSESPLAKRIKRHVVGQVRDFFISTAPGLEKLCADELAALPLSAQNAVVVPGGVEFKGRLHDCYLANLCLRTVNRILMRIGGFKATNFKQLEKKLADVPWELWLRPGTPPRLSVTTAHSRLYHKAAIGDRISAAIATRLGQMAPESPAAVLAQQIFVRVADDRFTLSVDSSGENLYKRGIKKQGGTAPLRETTAAAALKLAGYTGREPLIDPMCGSGTFSLEGAMMASGMAPGSLREFAFTDWPSFRPGRWAHIRREAEKEKSLPEKPLVFASDKDEANCKALTEVVRENNFGGVISVRYRDFFDFSPGDLTDQTGLVALNPPYGLRLGTRKESAELFQAICRYLKKEYRGWKIAMIAPNRELARRLPFRLTHRALSHGGLRLPLLTGKIR